jgi:hypothetical protein
LCAANFHRSSSPVSGLRQRLADVCILSGRGIKVNRFSGKDQEVFPESREANSPRPREWARLLRQAQPRTIA